MSQNDHTPGFCDETATKVLEWLAEILGVSEWVACDGTETWDGDVAGSILNILKAARVYEDENGTIARHK